MNTKYNDFKTYTVSGNETVQDICMANNISESDLVQANPQIPLASYGGSFFSSEKYKLDIKPGDVLKIPFYNEEKDKRGVKVIKGNRTVKVGVWENYEVTDWYEGTPVEDRSEEKVKWDLYYIQNGTKPELILQKEEGKIRFQEKAVGNKYKVVAYLDEPNLNDGSALLIEVEASEKKEILSIKISDSNNKPISGPLAYGEKVNVHVDTTGMKGEYIYITLWEDDANGEGHDEANKYNQVGVKERALVGEKGVAHAIFTLNPDFKKIANAHLSKGDSNEGKTHEYYAIAHASGDSKASANFNVRNPDYKEKRKEEIEDHLKGSKPKPSAPDYKGPVKKEEPKPPQSSQVGISAIYIANDKGEKLAKSAYGNTIRIYIASKGLKNKKVRLWLYEKDTFDPNDELYSKDIFITSDLCYENIKLTKAMQDKGSEYEVGEGSSQELFARAKVMDVPSHIFSKNLQADISSVVVDVAESTTVAKVADVKVPKKEEEKKTGCICQDYDLIWGSKVSCEFRKRVVEISKSLGLPQEKNEGANWLMAVMALETGRSFSATAGTFKKHKDDTKNGYVGLIQIGKVAAIDLGVKRTDLLKLTNTKQLDYVEKFFQQKKFTGKLKTKTDLYLAVNYPNACGHGTEKDYVVYDSTKDAYDDNPMFKREKHEYYFDKKGKKQFYEGKKGSSYVWEFEEAINDFYNEGVANKLNFFGTCAVVLKNTTDKDIVTYHVFQNGKIEKRIPQQIKEGFENKYKYVYHDKNDKEHPVCILDWHKTKGKEEGVVYKSKPTHAEVLTDDNVSDGSTSRRVKYKNGDIAEYGKHPTKGLIWRLYKSNGQDIELIKMADSLNYSSDGVVIKYEFSQTKRRYTGPGVFAGFIGALAECSFSEGIVTTGSCFREASCFPSAEHVNGRSVDSIYYKNIDKDQKFVDAVIKFKFTEVLVGNDDYCKKIKNASDGGTLHNSHLHSGNFSDDKITVIKK